MLIACVGGDDILQVPTTAPTTLPTASIAV